MQIKNYSDLKKNNINNILLTLLKKEALSRSQLSSSTGLTRSAITSLTKELLEKNIITESKQSNNKVGRPSIMLKINNTYVAFSAEIAKDFIRLAVIGLNGEEIVNELINLANKNSPEIIFKKINEFIQKEMPPLINNKFKIIGLGISAPGLIDSENKIVEFSPNLKWEKVKVMDYFKNENFDFPIILDNNVNMMSIAEKMYGKGKNCDSLGYIHIGTGIGFAIIIQNFKLLRGNHNGAGELGHCTIVPDGPLCSCGKHGCLEALISEKHLTKKYKNLGQKNINYNININQLIKLTNQGDQAAKNILLETINFLGIGISMIYNLFEPELLILSGDNIYSSDFFIKNLKKKTRNHCFSKNIELDFIENSYSERQAVVGAAAELFNQYIFSLGSF